MALDCIIGQQILDRRSGQQSPRNPRPQARPLRIAPLRRGERQADLARAGWSRVRLARHSV